MLDLLDLAVTEDEIWDYLGMGILSITCRARGIG
jgi:hypothetical protein